MAIAPQAEGILTVSELTRQIKEALQAGFPAVWVRGEISGFKRAESGHLYFTLKDADALLDAVMWRGNAGKLSFDPQDGLQVEAFGSVSVYERRGRYQLLCETLRPAGLGGLLLALEELKRRLQGEGLFDATRKVPLPRHPRRVGLVTSPVGAAVRDLVTVLRRRWPPIEIVLAPVRVQGVGAAEEIAAAVRAFNRYGAVDVLIVGRGGGSLEDLWAFNEEVVVRAVAESELPVVSAVGHEVDWTLCDLAADLRAATPSAAAEVVVPDHREVRRHLEHLAERARLAAAQMVADRRRRLETAVGRYGFRRSRDFIGIMQQRVDELAERLGRVARDTLGRVRDGLEALLTRYGLRRWPEALADRRRDVAALAGKLGALGPALVAERRRRLGGLGDRLRALGPQAVLERGYCLARRADGSLVLEAARLAVGESLALQFARGEAGARVERIQPGEADGSQAGR